MQSLMPPIDSSDNLFHNGNPLTGEKGTIVTADFLNNAQGAIRDVQTELIAVLTAAQVAPNANTAGQLLSALKKLLLVRSNPFSDIKADGLVSTALANLGLGDGSSLPVGVPVPWPLATPPTGWLKYNGSAFDKSLYPKLAAVYTSGVLPDLRGYFIRAADDGRGIDSARVLLSTQTDAIRNIIGTIGNLQYESQSAANGSTNTASGAFRRMKGTDSNGFVASVYSTANTAAIASTDAVQDGLLFDASSVVPTASENRPMNIAFNYIVRAA